MKDIAPEERKEFEQELREEAHREYIKEMHHEHCMAKDLEYATHHVCRQLSEQFFIELTYLKRDCIRYGLEWKEVLEHL